MDPLGNAQPVILPSRNVTVAAPALPSSSAQAQPVLPARQESFDPQLADRQQQEAIARLSQDVADLYVLGDAKFSLFKDSTGQYITRFTSLRDGKVTYIPQPTLFKLSGSSGNDVPPLLKIQA